MRRTGDGERMKIHFVGIAGAGMHSLALYLSEMGMTVSGSDTHMSAERQAFWAARGVKIFSGQAAENIAGADLVVYSSAVKPGNPERAAAEGLGIAHSRGEVLARFANAHPFSIAVCGTHGKGTTAAAVRFILAGAGHRVSHILGAVPIGENEPCGFSAGSEFLVSEVDESDKTHLFHRPKVLLINNIEADHLDVYGNLEGIASSFQSHVRRVLAAGTGVIIHYAGVGAPLLHDRLSDCGGIFWIASDADGKSIPAADLTYDVSDPDASGRCRVEVRSRSGERCCFEPMLCGRANAQNLVSAIGVAMACGIDMTQAATILQQYRGLCDRCEVQEIGGAWLATDYASHPTCVKNDIEWLRSRAKRLIAIYHPYRYSLMAHHWDALCHALAAADIVGLLPMDGGGEAEIAGISSEAMAAGINALNPGAAHAFASDAEAYASLRRQLNPGDLVVVFSGGRAFANARDAMARAAEK